MRLVINASDLAGCIGRNKYQDRAELKLKYLKQLCPLSFERIYKPGSLRDDKVKSALDKLQIISKETHGAFTSIHTQMSDLALKEFYAGELKSCVSKGSKAIQNYAGLTASEKNILKEEYIKAANTALGTVSEAAVAEDLASDGKTIVKEDKYIKRRVYPDIYTTDGREIKVYIGGKCDGIQTDSSGNRTLIEIKNRTKRLFYKMVDYELVQLYAYMYIYELENGTLVERFQDQKRKYDVCFCIDEWNSISNGIKEFANEIAQMIISEEDACE